MNAVFQFLLANSWVLIPIVIGLFNVGVRVQQKAKQQQARRAAQVEEVRRRQEALRTGRPVEPAVALEEEDAGDRQERERRERVEALRQQRMKQLQVLREKRAGAQTSATSAPRPQSSQFKPPARTPSRPAPPSRPPPQAQPRTQFQSPVSPRIPRQQQPQAQPQPRPSTRPIPQSGPGPRPSGAEPLRIQPPERPKIAATDLRESKRAKRARGRQQGDAVSKPVVDTGVAPGRPGRPGSVSTPVGGSVRSMLSSPSRVRRAFVLREVLDLPVSLRDPTRGPGSMPN